MKEKLQEVQEGGKYDFRRDPRLRNVAKQIVVMMAIVYASGKFTKYLLNKYVWGGQDIEEQYTASD